MHVAIRMWRFLDNFFFLLSVHSSLKKEKGRPIMPNLACGRVPSPVCAVCFNACFIASNCEWPMLHLWDPQPGYDDRWACPPSGVTLTLPGVLVGMAGGQR